jgi:hypothetical protein
VRRRVLTVESELESGYDDALRWECRIVGAARCESATECCINSVIGGTRDGS